jgi:hypothetical protein
MLDNESPDGNLIIIDNHIIYTNYYVNVCDDAGEYKNSIVFLDTNMNLKNRLILGNDCEFDMGAFMDYINSDSIYVVHRSQNNFKYDSTTYYNFFISNFSKDGKLNFALNVDIKDSLLIRHIYGCKALPDGGVIAYGKANDFRMGYETERGYLLYYHPTKDLNNVKIETQSIASLPQIFPNPAHTHFTVTNTENATITMYNLVGQQVKQVVGKAENTIIQTEDLSSGMYILKVEKENGLLTKKVQVVR